MIEQHIGKAINCACGQVHKSRVESIVIKEHVIQQELIDFLNEYEYRRITVVCDKNSYRIAGKEVCSTLAKNGVSYKLHMFQDIPLIPNEYSVGNLVMGVDRECDILLAVGSGTINDLCRFVSAVIGKPFCTVGTASSMDGYISGGSALIYNKMKNTFETHAPRAVFFDPCILADAPCDMIASGVGDLLGKISCLSDWRLSNIVNDEWHCAFISDIVEEAIDKTIACHDNIVKGESDAVATLLEALLLSGVAMDYAGNSRPASGCEHHMSHFWEMRYILEDRNPIFHGTKVGIGTIISLKAYEYIAALSPDFANIKSQPRMSFEEWEAKVRKAYLDAADEIVDLERKSGKNSIEKLHIRLASIEANWEDIQALAKNISKPEVVEQILKQLHAPTKPYEIGVERDMAYQAIVYAKELRDRYTVLQLLWDLGELERFADLVIAEYYN